MSTTIANIASYHVIFFLLGFLRSWMKLW